jgi:hypothetical protein
MWVARRIRVCINYYSSSNDLWVHLLDGAPADLERYRDNKNEAVDAFAGQGVLLNHWQDLPA